MISPRPNCSKSDTYFESGNFLQTAYHVTAIINIPLLILSFYCILKHTENRLKTMKWQLFNFQICSLNFDFIMTVLSCPLIFFPSASGVSLGFFGYIGIPVKWQAYWGQVSLNLIGVSMIILYENRHNQIITIPFRMKNKTSRIIFYTLNYLSAFTIILPFYITNSNQQELILLVFKRIQCPTSEFFSDGLYVLLRGDEIIPFLSVTTGIILISGQILFFAFLTLYHLIFGTNINLSKTTQKLQKKLLANVSIQILIPLLIFIVPIIYSLYADRTDYYNQAYNNFAMIIMSTHGSIGPISTLLIYKPYREFVFHRILRIDRNSTSSFIEPLPAFSLSRSINTSNRLFRKNLNKKNVVFG